MTFLNSFLAFLTLVGSFLAPVFSENNDLVVFCHGYGGSSEHLHYIAEFEEAGLEIVAVNVDPYASNHDRAAELYAQIKGTIVDYGACHSLQTGHIRFGEDYTGKGILPEWSENHQIHLIGHSQGGLTVRYLERMLEIGSGCKADEHEMYTGGKSWITSLTTMATPNNGATPFDPDFGKGTLLMKAFANDPRTKTELSFKQWGLERRDQETFDQFWSRLEDSGLFENKDFGIYDMSTKGALEFNSNGPNVYDGRYYFAIATERTNPEPRCELLWCDTIEVPDPKMNEYYWDTAAIIGSAAFPEDRENDGIVSNSQARCPKGEVCIQIADGNVHQWGPSLWHMIDLYFLDHMQLVERDDENDNNNFMESAKRIWLEHAVRIKKLPSKSISLSRSEAFEAHEKVARLERYLGAIRELSTTEEFQKEVTPGMKAVFVIGVMMLGSAVALVAVKGAKFGRKIMNKRNDRVQSEGHATTYTV